MKKQAGVLLVLCTLVISLLSCGQASGALSTVDRIKEAGVLKAGVALSWPPMGFRDDKGAPIGFDVDWATKMAEMLGVRVDFIDLNVESRIPALLSGQVDVLFSDMTRTSQRAEVIDFSIPYLRCGIKTMTRAGSPYKEIDDINDPKVKIVAHQGSTGEDLALALAPKAEIIRVSDFADQILYLMQGKADVTFDDSILVDYAVKESGGALETRDRLYTYDPICVGLPKDDFEFISWVNMFVSLQINQGWQLTIYEKWFGAPPEAKP